MQAERPTHLIDPVCGMTVDVAKAEAAGLLLEHEGRTYAFCRPGCRRAFVEDPAEYVAKAEAAAAADRPSRMRTTGPAPSRSSTRGCGAGTRAARAACRDAYPEIKAQLDAERAAAAAPPVDAASARSPRLPRSPRRRARGPGRLTA